MEIYDILNIYSQYNNRIQDLWRSLWPNKERRKNKRIRN